MTKMQDISHTNPQDPRNVFGELYRRGPTTVADGGTPTGKPRAEDDADDVDDTPETTERMKDIDHTAADEDRNPNRVWSRGSEDEVRES